MPNVPFTASANATPASTITVATHTVNSVELQVMHIGDASGSLLGTSTSPIHAAITNTASVIINSGSVVVTNALSASISNTVTVAQGASGASPWGVRVVDKTGASEFGTGVASPLFATVVSASLTNVGTGAASPIFVSVNNLTGSAAGSPAFVSACITNFSGSAAGSPLFTSITNLAGSAAGSPLFVSQNNMTGSAAGSPTFVSVNNLTGSAAGSPTFVSVNNLSGSVSGSPIFASITNTASVIATLGGNQMLWGGSILTVNYIDLSTSAAGCTRIVASGGAGSAIVIVAATFTTSTSQFIGWIASGAGAASAPIQTRMPFGTNGGMDANRMPHGHLWIFPSGSNAILTTTSACVVAGTINYLMVASA